MQRNACHQIRIIESVADMSRGGKIDRRIFVGRTQPDNLNIANVGVVPKAIVSHVPGPFVVPAIGISAGRFTRRKNDGQPIVVIQQISLQTVAHLLGIAEAISNMLGFPG